jgi:hypothetical protein
VPCFLSPCHTSSESYFLHEEHTENVRPNIECVTDVLQPSAACHSLGRHSSRSLPVCKVFGLFCSSRALLLLRATTLFRTRLREPRTVHHRPTSRPKLQNLERRPRQRASMAIIIANQPQARQSASMVIVDRLIRLVPHLSRQHAQRRL